MGRVERRCLKDVEGGREVPNVLVRSHGVMEGVMDWRAMLRQGTGWSGTTLGVESVVMEAV